jgi:hypothetical protein
VLCQHLLLHAVASPHILDCACCHATHETLCPSVTERQNCLCAQAAYNWALAAYFHHGKDHSETKAAVAATKAADPQAWVPKLLAGLRYPPLAMSPTSRAGSKMEAVVGVQRGRTTTQELLSRHLI